MYTFRFPFFILYWFVRLLSFPIHIFHVQFVGYTCLSFVFSITKKERMVVQSCIRKKSHRRCAERKMSVEQEWTNSGQVIIFGLQCLDKLNWGCSPVCRNGFYLTTSRSAAAWTFILVELPPFTGNYAEQL